MVNDKISMMSPPATVAIPMAKTIAQGTAVEAFEAYSYIASKVSDRYEFPCQQERLGRTSSDRETAQSKEPAETHSTSELSLSLPPLPGPPAYSQMVHTGANMDNKNAIPGDHPVKFVKSPNVYSAVFSSFLLAIGNPMTVAKIKHALRMTLGVWSLINSSLP